MTLLLVLAGTGPGTPVIPPVPTAPFAFVGAIGGWPIGMPPIGGGSADRPGGAAGYSPPGFFLLEHDGRTYLLNSGGFAMSDFWLAKGDLLPLMLGQMVDANLDPLDLTGGVVRLKAIDRDTGAVVIDQPASITDPTGGRVAYAWQAADTANKAELLARMVATTANGAVVRTPNVGYVGLHIGN